MKKMVLFALNIYLLASCSNKNDMPPGILSKKQMQAVMWDMTRAGEFLNGFVLNKDSGIDKVAESQKWYDKIYQIHKTSKDEFGRSLAYYEQHPVLLKEIMDSLARKQVAARPYSPATSTSTTDSARKKSLFPTIDTRIKRMDSVGKKRILKKRPGVQ